MKLTQKVQKAFSADFLLSGLEHFNRILHPVSARQLHRELENESWAALRERYPRDQAAIHRFADTRFWIKRNIERAQDLSLDRVGRRHILDLGCGPGYFLYVAQKLGHSAIGLDIDERPLFRDTIRLLNVRRIVHRIEPRSFLARPEQKFDLITSFLTCFHRIERTAEGDWRTWSTEDWQFFLDDIRAHQLREGGTLLLEFHPQKDGRLYPAHVRDLFVKNGARIFRSKVTLR